MKKLFFAALLAALSSCMFDGDPGHSTTKQPDPKLKPDYVVSYEEALATLQDAVNDIDTPETRQGRGPRKIANHYTVGQPADDYSTRTENGEAPEPYVHIFNFENEQGFAMISGDRRTAPILAITESGSLYEGKEIDNPGLAIFLANVGVAFRDIPHEPVQNPDYQPEWWSDCGPWEHSVCPSKGLSFNNWGQSISPYNDLTPDQMPSGCVATATAIIMAFHKYPYSNNGYFYNWDEMVKHMPYGMNTINETAYIWIARLMQQLGLPENLNMKYGEEGSGAYTYDILRTLRNFGYSNEGTYGEYSQEKVMEELKAGYAVIAGGYSTKIIEKDKFLGIVISTKTYYDGGHAWVIDGLLESKRSRTDYCDGQKVSSFVERRYLVHCNWGWRGRDNGYYYNGVFNAKNHVPLTREGTPLYFKFLMETITGIRR